MSFIGKSKGFGQRFTPPDPSPYLEFLAPYVGPYVRSQSSLKHVRDEVKGYKPNNTQQPTNDAFFKLAIRRTQRAFFLPTQVKMLHLNDVFKRDLPIWTSSPGLPWIQQGIKKKSEIRDDPDMLNRVRWFWHRVKEGKRVYYNDCCAYVRPQLVKQGDVKCRAVWGYPATMVFGEAVFALPLLDAYAKIESPFAFGYETGVGGANRIFHSFKGAHFLGVDYKSFDKTVPEWMIRIAFDVLASNIDFMNYQDHGVARVDAIDLMWNAIIDYFINTPIRLCNGERYQKHGGIASGSYFTQLVGSIVNYMVMEYISIITRNEIKSIKVLGDDSICGFEKFIPISDVVDLASFFGLVVNSEKTTSSKYISDITFLGYKINGGIPTKDRDKTIAGLVYPERPDRDWNDVASRALGILYSNLGVDDHVDYWCRRIVKFRPFELTLSKAQDKHLRIMKLGITSTEPPDMYDFYRRLTSR